MDIIYKYISNINYTCLSKIKMMFCFHLVYDSNIVLRKWLRFLRARVDSLSPKTKSKLTLIFPFIEIRWV